MSSLNNELVISGAHESVNVNALLSWPNSLTAEVQAKIVYLVWDQIEPQRKEWETGSFIYSSNRPTETYVVYILNKIVLESLAHNFWKSKLALHIHENINTPWHVICWPQQINTVKDAEKVLLDWLWLIGVLFWSNKTDINEFYDKKNSNWIEDTITKWDIKVYIAN